MYKARFSSLLLMILCLASGVFAQSQATTGNIEGRVVDANNAIVSGVSVTATNKDTGFTKTTTSNGDGIYSLIFLTPGNYQIQTNSIQGFSAANYDNIVVTVGGKITVDINLSINASGNVVNVQSTGEVVETTRTSIASTVSQQQIRNLPVNGRNFLDFVTLTPGIIRDPTRGGDLSVGGQRGTLNSLQIDGVSNDNTFFGQTTGRTGSGRAPYQFSIDTVKEFQINQNGFSAEYGRAGGAVINVVTKSGTNNFTGSAFEYFRDSRLNSSNPVIPARGPRKPKSQINQFGGTFGGAFVKDKAFFFAAYDGQRSDLPQTVVLGSLSTALPTVQTILSPKVNNYSFSRTQDVFLLKTDFNINDKNQLSVRFNQQNFTGTNNENAGQQSAQEHSGNSKVKTSTITTSLNTTILPNYINEFRFQYARDSEPGQANSDAPETNITVPEGTFSFGRNNFSPRETTTNRVQFIDNQTYIAGRNTLKYGVDILSDRVFNFFPGLFSGVYNFTSYATFAANTPSRYRQNFAGAGTSGATTHPNNVESAFFFQDDIRASQKLTVNVGLRYDYQKIAKPPITNPNALLAAAGYDTGFRPSDKNNIAPRIGASYAFDSKTVIRGGYGIYYARTPSIVTGTAHSQNGIQVVGVDINCATATCPMYPSVLTSPSGTLASTNIYLFSKDYKQPYVQQARASFEREILPNLSVSVSYLLYNGKDLTRTRDANLSAPVDMSYAINNLDGTSSGMMATFQRFPPARQIAGFTRISLFESTAKSFYQGFVVEANRRFSNRLQFVTSYTLSKAKDDKPDQTSVVVGTDDAKQAQNQFNLAGEYGRSDVDLRHRFIFSPVYDTGKFGYSENPVLRALLSDYLVSAIFQAQSGFAYSALVSGDPNGDGNTANDRFPGTKRNQFSTPNTYQLDLRVSRAIVFNEHYRFTIFGEGFNIFNRANPSAVFNTQYALGVGNILRPQANFQLSRSFLTERQFQLAARFDF